MSSRDKLLIFVVLIIGIIGGGYQYLIAPAMEENEKLITLLEKTQVEYDKIKLEVDMLPIVLQNYNDAVERLEEARPAIDPYREEEDIDRLFTTNVENHNLIMDAIMITTVQEKEEDNVKITRKDFELTLRGTLEDAITYIAYLHTIKDVVIETTGISNGNLNESDDENGVNAPITITGSVYINTPVVEVLEEEEVA